MDVELYKSTYNEFDNTSNGGNITSNLIENGVKNSFLPDVRPAFAELGGIRYFKFFVKATKDLLDIRLNILETLSNTEEVYIAKYQNDKYQRRSTYQAYYHRLHYPFYP